MHDSEVTELEVCPLSKDQKLTSHGDVQDIELPVPDTTQVTA